MKPDYFLHHSQAEAFSLISAATTPLCSRQHFIFEQDHCYLHLLKKWA